MKNAMELSRRIGYRKILMPTISRSFANSHRLGHKSFGCLGSLKGKCSLTNEMVLGH